MASEFAPHSLVGEVVPHETAMVTFDLSDLFDPTPIVVFDLADHLDRGILLREKPFREALRSLDVEPYRDKRVLVRTPKGAIVQTWAYMLVATKLRGIAREVILGDDESTVHARAYRDALNRVDWSKYDDARVVVKGCANVPVPAETYVEATRHLLDHAQIVMFGEACSAVPVFKRPKSS